MTIIAGEETFVKNIYVAKNWAYFTKNDIFRFDNSNTKFGIPVRCKTDYLQNAWII